MFSLKILSGGVSAILILIGIINFINVMLTGIFTRRTELAVMEGVGMTKKQVQKMLMLEGIYYAVITLALILTAGSGIRDIWLASLQNRLPTMPFSIFVGHGLQSSLVLFLLFAYLFPCWFIELLPKKALLQDCVALIK